MRRRIPRSIVSALLGAALMAASPQAHPGPAPLDQPRELGAVRWTRDHDAALARSAASGKPVLILFSEVPGCATCTGYADRVLTHPLIVEAAETLFEPVAIYNNAEGPDRAVLLSYAEPAWNNPVVRIVTSDRKALGPRLADDYSVEGLASHMTAALARAKRPAPDWLTLLALGARAPKLEIAAFAMHCFWEGEAKLGALPGVVSTRTGFVQGEEVVEVRFDPTVTPYAELVAQARSMQCATRVFARTDTQLSAARAAAGDAAVRTDEPLRPSPKDDKHALARSTWRFVPMTDAQASRVNADVSEGAEPSRWLSPRQQAIHDAIERRPDAGWTPCAPTDDLASAFARCERLARAG